MSEVTLCDQCGVRLPPNLSWLHLGPLGEIISYDPELDFCTWACLAKYATEQAQRKAA